MRIFILSVFCVNGPPLVGPCQQRNITSLLLGRMTIQASMQASEEITLVAIDMEGNLTTALHAASIGTLGMCRGIPSCQGRMKSRVPIWFSMKPTSGEEGNLMTGKIVNLVFSNRVVRVGYGLMVFV